MKRNSSFVLDLADHKKSINAVVVVAIVSVCVFTICEIQSVAAETIGNAVPIAAATPKKVKPVAPGDINGDPRELRTNSVPGRTETVNNNESLRSTTTVNSAEAQDGSGLDNANRRPKARVSGTAPAVINQPRSMKKNQDIEVENDETHRTSPTSMSTSTTKKTKRSGKHKKPSTKTPIVTTERPRDSEDKPLRKSPKP